MLRFLLDENLSYETAEFLNSLGFDAKTVGQFGLSGAKDTQIVEIGAKENRILLTFDLDFGEIFYFETEKKLCVVVLRLRDQTVESVHKALKQLLDSRILERKKYQQSLLIVGEEKIRIRKRA